MNENRTVIRGVDARIVWGYQLAATVRQWTAVKAAHSSTVTATVDSVDTFRVSQRPLTFVVTHQHGSWRWDIETLQIADGVVTATLRPPEGT